jgi:hypothetical protein
LEDFGGSGALAAFGGSGVGLDFGGSGALAGGTYFWNLC